MRFATPVRSRRGVNITPLIDVIFLLVLFFLLASVFSRIGAIDVSARLPGAATPVPGTIVLLRVAPGGTLDLNGQPVDRDALEERIGDPQTQQVFLMPRPGANMQDYVGVLDELQRAGYTVRLGGGS